MRATDWASSRVIRLVNLSLGTSNGFREPELATAVERGISAGHPGSMPGVVGMVLDPDQPRESVNAEAVDRRVVLLASGFPRPIAGVPPDRNLNGISFAVANANGVLASVLVVRPDVHTAAEAVRLVTG